MGAACVSRFLGDSRTHTSLRNLQVSVADHPYLAPKCGKGQLLNYLRVCCSIARGARRPCPSSTSRAWRDHGRHSAAPAAPAPSLETLPRELRRRQPPTPTQRSPMSGRSGDKARLGRPRAPPWLGFLPASSAPARRYQHPARGPPCPVLSPAMGRRALLLFLPPVLAALGGLEGSGAGKWEPCALRRPGEAPRPSLQGAGGAGCGAQQGRGPRRA